MNAENKNQKKHQKELEKQSDQVQGSNEYNDILKRVIHEGEGLFKIKSKAMFLSAIIAGLEIGFSYLLICMLYQVLGGSLNEDVVIKLFSVVYPVGFVLVILGKSALFTEQTSVLALPVLNGQRSIWELLGVWAVVILGNILGGMFFVFFIGSIGPHMNLFSHEIMVKIGTHVLNYDSWVLLLSGITAGWLMGLLTWLMNSSTNTFARIFLIFMITGVIGFGGFHHSIVGNLEVFGAFLYSDEVSIYKYLWFLFLVLLGNGIGGSVVVGLFKYRIFTSNHEKP